MIRNLSLAATAAFALTAFAHQPAPDPAMADHNRYLSDISQLCRTDWPDSRTVNIVCHGHSVPAGYFKTPEVRPLEAYPHLLRAALAKQFPHAVINVIVTAIGGEDAEAGAQRF